MFGKVKEIPQNENTPFYPRSPYGISKVTGYDLTRNFRESYNLFCCSGISISSVTVNSKHLPQPPAPTLQLET